MILSESICKGAFFVRKMGKLFYKGSALCQVLGRDYLNHVSLLGVGLFLSSYKYVNFVIH